MNDQPPQRVRVTGPPRRRAVVVRPTATREIDAETALGEVFMRSVLAYPWLVLLGWFYIRRSEAHERDFADLVGSVDEE